MEPLARPHHRRKHSAAPNAFPVVGSTPYDDVLVSRGGRGRSLEAHEYTEIFAGSSSSIPVLDLLDLDERVDAQISVRDYSNIFGGLRNDDLAAPYEELFNVSVKKAKPRTRAKSKPPLQQSDPLHSPGNTRKPSNETCNQSVDEVKQQFNVSFNKTNQSDNDVSDGKTHIAQLHSVPGFTYFVDEAPLQQKTEEHKPVPPLKRDVSRTWSFSGQVKDVKGKRGVSSDKSRVPDVSHNMNEANVKSASSKVPTSSNRPLNPKNSKDPKHVRASNLTSMADASRKIADEYSPPLLDEGFDENSAAAASAAALKKAIEQAQESIRLAKLIMERKKAGHDQRSKSSSRGHLKGLPKKTEVEHEVHDPKENNFKEEHEKLGAKFVGVDGKCIPSLGETHMLHNAGSAVVETVWEKVEATKEHGEQFGTSSSNHHGRIPLGEKDQLGNNWKNVEAAKINGEVTECRPATLGSEMVGGNNGMMLSTSKLGPATGRIETLKQKIIAVSHTGPVVERDLNTSQRMQDQEESVMEPEQYQATFDKVRGPEISAEPLARNVDKDTNWRISLEEEVVEARENDVYDMEQHGEKFEECEEVHHLAQLPALESAFSVFLKESRSLLGNAVLEQEEMECNPSGASDCKENGHNDRRRCDEGENKMRWEEAHLSFEGEEHPEEVSRKDEIKVRELGVHPEIGKVEKKVDTCEPEIEKKQNHSKDGDEPKIPGALDQDKVEERYEDAIEGGAIESRFMEAMNFSRAQESEKQFGMWKQQVPEADYFAEAQKNDLFWDEEETNNTLRGAGRSEDCNEERHGNTFGLEADKIQATEAYIFEEVQKNDPVWDAEETSSPLRGDVRSENKIEESCTSECIVHESQSMEADIFAEVPMNGASWNADETISSLRATGRFEEHCNDERHEITSDHEADESQELEADEIAEVQKNEPFWDVETSSTLRGKGRSEELHTAVEFQVADDEHVDADPGDVRTVFNEPQETCEDDLDGITEQHQETVYRNMENDTEPDVSGSHMYKDLEPEELFHLEDSEIPGIDSLCRIVSDEIFVESKQNNASEDLASDSKNENAGVTDSDSTENSSADVNAFKTDSEIRGTAQYYADENLSDAISSDYRNEEFDLSDERPVLEQTSESDEGSMSTSIPEDFDKLSTHESEEFSETAKDVTPNKEEILNEPKSSNEKNFTEERSEGCSQFQNEPKETEKLTKAKKCEETSSNIENNLDPVGGVVTEERDAEATVENIERQQRIEAIKRAREREKEKLAVERVIREARERAFAEAQKSAAEKAAAGAQKRIRTEAQEKLEKAAAVKQPVDKASTEAKLRAERAAVERALAEARGRALEKALSQKTSSEARTAADRSNALKHSFSSSDLENTTATESAQRRKARLERHQRIMERAAKALAEKNKRDILAQKEQAERNRLADSLDADIKRWATGKEGNLRALLSTLQYILGRDSGWLPIPLTEIVTTAAVKKAYRKATLYVHPDKLQQRGASIRQKYICEKVFDLLKAAWNKFNSEER